MQELFRNRAALVALALTAALAVVWYVPTDSAAARAARAKAASKTELGTSAGEMVTLVYDNPLADPLMTFSRVEADGTLDDDFEIPDKTALYVTDMDWHWEEPEFVNGENFFSLRRVLRLRIQNRKDTDQIGTVHKQFLGNVDATIDNEWDFLSAGSTRLDSGFVVGADGRLTVDVVYETKSDGRRAAEPFRGEIVLRGYLLKDK